MDAPVTDLLIGPTASGKSAAGLLIARRRRAEILSVDSMKLYRQFEIGVAKPSRAVRAEVRHHLMDWKEPWESASVAEWLAAAEEVISACAARGQPLLAEGGTALYLKALREGLFKGPGRDEALRARLEAEAREKGLPALHARLQKVDPEAAAKIMPQDQRRVVRALEVNALSGRPISQWQAQWGRLRDDLRFHVVGLAWERSILYRRIDARVERMLQAGWLDECRRLLALERPLSREARQALGYRTLFAHLRGLLSLDEARARIAFDTHHFARRQLAWFRRFPDVHWVEVREEDSTEQIAEKVEAAFHLPRAARARGRREKSVG